MHIEKQSTTRENMYMIESYTHRVILLEGGEKGEKIHLRAEQSRVIHILSRKRVVQTRSISEQYRDMRTAQLTHIKNGKRSSVLLFVLLK